MGHEKHADGTADAFMIVGWFVVGGLEVDGRNDIGLSSPATARGPAASSPAETGVYGRACLNPTDTAVIRLLFLEPVTNPAWGHRDWFPNCAADAPVTAGGEDGDFAEILAPLRTIASALANTNDQDELLDRIVELAVAFVPGAEHAGVTRRRNGRFVTWSATSDLVQRVDDVQYREGGPCVATIEAGQPLFRADDLRNDPRWPTFGPEASDSTGVRSMMSHRMFFADDAAIAASLNLYSTEPAAFDAVSEGLLLGLVTQSAFAIALSLERERSDNLEIALQTSRQIGIAMGVLLWRYKITVDNAFDLPRLASQGNNRRLASIALEVIDTGEIPLPPSFKSDS